MINRLKVKFDGTDRYGTYKECERVFRDFKIKTLGDKKYLIGYTAIKGGDVDLLTVSAKDGDLIKGAHKVLIAELNQKHGKEYSLDLRQILKMIEIDKEK